MKGDTPRIEALLLAAGPSSRLGRPKQLVRVGDQSLVRRAAGLLLGHDSVSVTVVTGCESEQVEAELKDLPLTLVYNRNWQQGMGSSISCGAHNITGPVDGVLLMVCDQWRLEKYDIAALISFWLSDISGIVVAQWNEEKAFVSGPPVIFPRNLIPELISVVPERGARQVIDRNMDLVRYLKLENAAEDLDRPEDLERLIRLPGPSPSS